MSNVEQNVIVSHHWKTKPKMERHDVNKKGYNAIHCQKRFTFSLNHKVSHAATLNYDGSGRKNHYGFVPGFPGFLPSVLRRIYNYRSPGKSMM